MVNRDLLKTPKELLSELDKQRLHLLRVESAAMPCPACKTPVDAISAAGIDLDAYDFGTTRYSYRCPTCSAEVDQVVPLFPGGGHVWLWQLKESWLQAQRQKAKAFDQLPKAKEGTGPA
jgi:uncharacterized protein (UPF0212 family)